MGVRIYVKRGCAWSAGAKRLLDEKGIAYEEIDVTARPERRADIPGMTLPQVFIGGRRVGGYAELQELDRTSGIRTALLDDPAAP